MTFEKGLLCFQVCFSSCVVHSLYCIISSYGQCVYTNWVIRWHQRASHHRNTIVTEMTNFWFGLEIIIFFIVFILTSVISLIGNLFYDQLTDYALILISVMKNDLTTHKVSAAFISVVGPFQAKLQSVTSHQVVLFCCYIFDGECIFTQSCHCIMSITKLILWLERLLLVHIVLLVSRSVLAHCCWLLCCRVWCKKLPSGLLVMQEALSKAVLFHQVLLFFQTWNLRNEDGLLLHFWCGHGSISDLL